MEHKYRHIYIYSTLNICECVQAGTVIFSGTLFRSFGKNCEFEFRQLFCEKILKMCRLAVTLAKGKCMMYNYVYRFIYLLVYMCGWEYGIIALWLLWQCHLPMVMHVINFCASSLSMPVVYIRVCVHPPLCDSV